MNNKKLLIIVILLIPLAVISFFIKETNFNLDNASSKREEIIIRLKEAENNNILELSLEDYIIGVVAAEMPASFSEEALKAQAVASRTYAISKLISSNENFNLVNSTDNQVYISIDQMKEKWQSDFEKYYHKVKDCVDATKNQIITYNNEIITSYYFAMSNGFTENSELVFKENIPYLKSVASEGDNDSLKNYSAENKLSTTEFCNKLNIECNKLNIEIINRSESNRVLSLKVNDLELEGTQFRKLLGLRSTDFEINTDENFVYINTKGYGHGVGMSQYGANGMAKKGYNYQEIIKHYYLDVEINDLISV